MNIIVGLNSSGKSNFIQCLDFISCLMAGSIDPWLSYYGLPLNDIPFNDSVKNPKITFRINFSNDKSDNNYWKCVYDTELQYCIEEQLCISDCEVLVCNPTHAKKCFCEIYQNGQSDKRPITCDNEGSIFAKSFGFLSDDFSEFRDFITNILKVWKIPDIKQPVKQIPLYAIRQTLQNLTDPQHETIQQAMKKAFPNFEYFKVSEDIIDYGQLIIGESSKGEVIQTAARNVSDGMLQYFIILLALHTPKYSVLLFDDIGDHTNTEVVDDLSKGLNASEKQIILTTHNPLILNYFEDDVAVKSMQFFYKTLEGCTQTVPFFSLLDMTKKLGVMGPGEVFADTSLYRLVEFLTKTGHYGGNDDT
jgi:predicted ATP-dependent endonuclease of OLD family